MTGQTKKTTTSLLRGLAIVALSASLAAGCTYQDTSKGQADLAVARTQTLGSLVVASVTPQNARSGPKARPVVVVPTSTPQAEVGSVLISGSASYCKPTPKYCHGWGEPALLGAVPTFKWGDKPYVATVCRGSHCVAVKIVSFCACGHGIIDLSPAAFKRLGVPLSRGRVMVTVEYGGHIKLPATDTE